MAKLSPVLNDAQFDADGNFLVGGKIYTYVAGSTTPTASYTTSAGNVPQSNPIILNAEGRVDDPIWLQEGRSYKLRLFAADDTFTGVEFDNITGVGDSSSTDADQWVDSGLTPTYLNATQFTVQGDQTSVLQVNRRVKIAVTAGTIYGYISASAYTSLTTVTVILDSGTLDAGISDVSYGLISVGDTSLPKIPNWVDSAMIKDDAIIPRMAADSMYGISMNNGQLVASVGGNALTIALKTKAGTDATATDPIYIIFRSATITSGEYFVRQVTSALSISVSSGSTLGTTSAVLSQIDVLAIDNAGAVELAVVNDNGATLDGQSLISTTAEGGAGAADSVNTIYSATARSNVPYRYIGYVQSTQATAGTWATSPSKIQLANYIPTNGSQITIGTPVATTSGTLFDFAVPTWAKEIKIMFFGVSTSGTDEYLVQLINPSGVINTGYASRGALGVTTPSIAVSSATTGFVMRVVLAPSVVYGSMTISKSSATVYEADHVLTPDISRFAVGGGMATVTGPITGVRITTLNGTDTFDAGSINIRWQ